MARRWEGPATILALALLGAAAGDGVLSNGDFEKGLDGWKKTGLTDLARIDVDEKVRFQGKRSGHIVKTGARGPALDALTAAIAPLPDRERLTVTAQVKGKDLGNAWLKLFVYDEGGEIVVSESHLNEAALQGTFEWRKLEKTFEIPRGAVRAELSLILFLDGEAWIDGVKAVPEGKPRGKPAAGSPAPLDPKTRAWLDGNAVPLRTLACNAPFEDLKPLEEALRGARIVQLGESTHGDGATSKAKARLVRFLHERMGFEVVAFESGLFECDRANALLREGRGRVVEAMHAALFGVWRTYETAPLFEHMAEKARSDRPLLLAGFDIRSAGTGAAAFADRFLEFLAPAGAPAKGDADAFRGLHALLQGDAYKPDPKARAAGLEAHGRLKALLESGRERLARAHGEAETAFFARCLESWRLQEECEFAGNDPSLGEFGTVNMRDRGMAENLRWLADVRYPGKKIVTWGATFHLARGLAGVEVSGNSKHYAECRNMGQAVADTFGKECVTVGFLASKGKAGSFGRVFPVPRPREGSVEDLLGRYGKPLLFVDLRKPGGPFDAPLRAAPMSYDRNIVARWPSVVDAFVYVEDMTPTEFLPLR